jgi:hypothetical protein
MNNYYQHYISDGGRTTIRPLKIYTTHAKSHTVDFASSRLILEDTSHQQTIYECLNSQEIRRLFESIHDEDQQLRMTAIKFVCHLLHDNSQIMERLSMMEGCSLGGGTRKVPDY